MKFRNLSYSLFIINRVKHLFIGKFNYLNAKWWGVSLKKNVSFDGKCFFHRFPKSVISIGYNCKFLSRLNSNLIGINRPCSISTLNGEAILEIGNNCGFSGTVIGVFKVIRIGNNVKCGANTLITDGDWHIDDQRSGIPSDIIIEDNVWLGEGVKVLKGVIIGANSVIGAGSVVTKSIPPNVVAAGNPCKVIREMILNEK